MKKKYTNNHGSALVVSILVLMIIVTIALSLTLVSVQNQTASGGEAASSQSFQMADTGIENLMYDLTKAGKTNVNELTGCKPGGLIAVGNYIVTLLDGSGAPINCSQNISISNVITIKSVSNMKNQSRAVEADVICHSPFKPDASTVALYSFQETGNSILDYSGRNNVAGVSGTVPVITGICNARSYDGNPSDYISAKDYNDPTPTNKTHRIPGINTGNPKMSLEAWVKLGGAAITKWERIVGKGNDAKRNYDLGVSASGWEFQFNNGAGVACDVSKSVTAAGSWHFIAGVYDGSNIKLYIDGAPASSSPCAITPATDNSDLIMGASPGIALSVPFLGIIDEVIVDAKDKSDSDIQVDYNAGKIFHRP